MSLFESRVPQLFNPELLQVWIRKFERGLSVDKVISKDQSAIKLINQEGVPPRD